MPDGMAGPTREEFDAKLQAAEARTETRYIELLGKMDRVLENNQRLGGQIAELRTDNKNTRITIIIVVISAVLAGLGAFWEAENNMLAAFQSGLGIYQAKPATTADSSAGQHSP